MAALPSPIQVSGKFNAIYEAYYKQIDPKNTGSIEAMSAAKFLKKSGLSDVVLSRIWDLSDPSGRGFLDKDGVFVALKLVALAQAGHDINMRNIFIEPPNPPKVGEVPKILPPKIQTVAPTSVDWTIGVGDRNKYEALFESLQPVDGLLPGNKVRGVLMDSKLPLDSLSKIWDLADQDKDGSLDKHEFIVAMHLVYQALDKKAIPSSLPIELQRPKPGSGNSFSSDTEFVANFPSDIAPPPPVPPLPVAAPPPAIPPMPRMPSLISTDLLISTAPVPIKTAPIDWVVSAADKLRFDAMFTKSDLDNDGLVSGIEIKDVFLQSGIPNICLAQIWALCDTNQSGKLTSEQFALAMWMVDRKRNGIDPPDCLAPNMVPPSLRGGGGGGGGGSNNIISLDDNLMQAEPAQPTYSNPELAMLSSEIEELAKERRLLESDVTHKEADIRIKSGELRSLQSELDTLAATLKQLENQKGEAQKRLDDLKTQVNKIRDQCQKQEDTIREQEGELDSKRGELQKLKDEESALEKEYDTNRRELENLSRNLQDTQLQISQIKAMVSQLQESQRQMSDALVLCKSAISANDPLIVSDYSLKLQPDFREAKSILEDKKEKTVPSNGFGESSDFRTDQFNSNGFGSDPFTASQNTGGFAVNFNTAASGFDDSFSSSGYMPPRTADPFQAPSATLADPFGDKRAATSITPDPGKDDFGSDPFAILHAPTSSSQILSPSPSQNKSGPPPRPESPSPALPPKKAKQPPPRPAPPRPSMGPTPTRPEPPAHGFGSSPGGFADFADFDNKNINSNITSSTHDKQTNNNIKTSTTAIDFAEDPFKDYRYEDPFSIKDPFSDDIVQDQFSSFPVVDKKYGMDRSNTPSKTPNSFATFEDKFTATTASSENDFFAAFNDNFNKNKTDTLGFDPFGGGSNPNLSASTISTISSKHNFEDEFSTINITNNNIKKSTASPNFGKFNAFKDDEGNFGAASINFTDAFGGGNKITNKKFDKTLDSKKTNQNEKLADELVKSKFAADYSKGDTFDQDLNEILKRSVVDQ